MFRPFEKDFLQATFYNCTTINEEKSEDKNENGICDQDYKDDYDYDESDERKANEDNDYDESYEAKVESGEMVINNDESDE